MEKVTIAPLRGRRMAVSAEVTAADTGAADTGAAVMEAAVTAVTAAMATGGTTLSRRALKLRLKAEQREHSRLWVHRGLCAGHEDPRIMTSVGFRLI